MPEVLMFADTLRSPELRHEVPVPVTDPIIYLEQNGTRRVFASSLELPRLAAVDALEVLPEEELGSDELIAAGIRWHDAYRELVLRACRHAGLVRASVPRSFPLAIADHLRANGVELEVDGELFDHRRRSKSPSELDGIRKAQRAAERAMARIRDRLAEGPVTCEELQAEAARVFTDDAVTAPDGMIVSHGAQTAIGHEQGHGPVAPGEPVVVDLFPLDPDSGCFADLTRTFCLDDPPEELVTYHRLCREALERVVPAIRAGADGTEIYAISAEVFERAGYPTQRTKEPGRPLDHGYFHSLGHGVGLEVHELPLLGLAGHELVAGDVVTIEPGCYRPGFGGCRLEDLVLVTEDGCEVLTDFPYDLTVRNQRSK
ncbi:MAG: Xaa-Pro peptidase family protein [Actinomycetota bacterium]|nr:Xaa-Pro peptidase family protein [Actinomycetota bacterium]